MPRFSAIFRTDARNTDELRTFARDFRRAVRGRLGYEWGDKDARLMRVQEPKDGRGAVVIKFSADGIGTARDFARDIRRAARRAVYGYGSRDTKLMKLVEPKSETATPEAAEAATPEATEAD